MNSSKLKISSSCGTIKISNNNKVYSSSGRGTIQALIAIALIILGSSRKHPSGMLNVIHFKLKYNSNISSYVSVGSGGYNSKV